MSVVGTGLDRTDGVAKVTGTARYAAEFNRAGLLHAALVQADVARGRIADIDVRDAEAQPGVVRVFTHRNAPRLPSGGNAGVHPPEGRMLTLLQDDRVRYNGQPVAVVVADTPERAAAAASRIHLRYAVEPATLDFAAAKASLVVPKEVQRQKPDVERGDVVRGFAEADVVVQGVYTTPMQHHNPLEPHATIAQWEGGKLTLHDSTQYVTGVKEAMAKALGIDAADVHVISPYVGGGFGCKGSMWSHVVLCAMCAREIGRPVKFVLARWQMWGPVGGRPRTEQAIMLGARRDGRLTAVRHDVISHTSSFEEFVEPSSLPTRMLYACDNLHVTQRLVKLDVGTPTFQRAPGEATGTFALEVALDELAEAARIDPIALRLANHAERDMQAGKPWSSKHLRECYAQGAERFGWARRDPRVGAMRDGDRWVGFGMATATYPANRMAARASARLALDGSFVVASGSQDIGTGTYTVMTQVAADALGVAPSQVRFVLGDTSLPQAPVSGGSMSAASVAPAVQNACRALRARIAEETSRDARSPLAGAPPDAIDVIDGIVVRRDDKAHRESIADFAARRQAPLDAWGEASPGPEKDRFSSHSFGAVFVEAQVDPWLCTIRLSRIVGCYDVGNRLNAKTADSQLKGGIVWGVGFALTEESVLDLATGHFVNANLADYHVPVNADIGSVDVSFVDAPDTNFNPLGIRGIGEIGITGIAAAIANAVYHASGVRVRDLPITVDKLLRGQRAGVPRHA